MKILVKSHFLLMKWVFIFSLDLDKINPANDKNVDKDDVETIIHVRLWLGVINLKNAKHLKKIQAKN